MGFRDLKGVVSALEQEGQLRRIEVEVDPHLEVGVIQRRVYDAGGPALLFTRVKGCSFPMLGNVFGTLDRARYLFRDTLPAIERLIDIKVDPGQAFRNVAGSLGLGRHAFALDRHPKPRREIAAHRVKRDRKRFAHAAPFM